MQDFKKLDEAREPSPRTPVEDKATTPGGVFQTFKLGKPSVANQITPEAALVDAEQSFKGTTFNNQETYPEQSELALKVSPTSKNLTVMKIGLDQSLGSSPTPED